NAWRAPSAKGRRWWSSSTPTWPSSTNRVWVDQAPPPRRCHEASREDGAVPDFENDPTILLRPQRTLRPHEDRVERRRRGDEQAVPLGAAEADIGDHLGNVDLAEESAVRAVAMDAIAGARPDVAAHIEPEAVEESRIAGRKDIATRERAAIRAHHEAPDMAGAFFHVGRAGVGDVEEFFIGREGQPIGFHEIGRHRRAVAGRRIVAVDEGGADLR